MAISAQQVKKLRDATGAGMADCKKALEESNNDFDLAVEFLRKKGAASAAKRADKETNEGLVVARTSEDGKKAVLVEITCETDFVAKNEEFVNYANTVAETLLSSSVTTVDELKALTAGGETIENLHNDILAKFSEKIDINRISIIETDGYVESYIHGGSKLGVLVEVSESVDGDNKELVKDIAMQVAAMRPSFVTRDEVTQDILDKEKEIFIEQAIEEGKTREIAEKVAMGRVNKYYKENCLVEQVYVKDSKQTITDVLKGISDTITVKQFIRLSIGEN